MHTITQFCTNVNLTTFAKDSILINIFNQKVVYSGKTICDCYSNLSQCSVHNQKVVYSGKTICDCYSNLSQCFYNFSTYKMFLHVQNCIPHSLEGSILQSSGTNMITTTECMYGS